MTDNDRPSRPKSDFFEPRDNRPAEPKRIEDLFDDDPLPSEAGRRGADNVYRFVVREDEDEDYVLIECPGATLYEAGTENIVEGVKYVDDDDPLAGYEIVGKSVHPPTHTRWRRIKKEALGCIRRCQACQDYTIRMRRPEGADFFIPSERHPGRTKLKSISHNSLG